MVSIRILTSWLGLVEVGLVEGAMNRLDVQLPTLIASYPTLGILSNFKQKCHDRLLPQCGSS